MHVTASVAHNDARKPSRYTAHVQREPTIAASSDTNRNEVLRPVHHIAPLLQRACACGGGCPSCRNEVETEASVQRRGATAEPSHTGFAPSSVMQTLAQPGRRLGAAERSFFEPRFGRDFSNVRVHDDAAAGRSARDVNALAYTVGRHIAFAPGQFRPQTDTGRALIGHELAHVVQQGGVHAPSPHQKLRIGAPHSAAECQAHAIGGRIGSGGAVKADMQPSTAARSLARADIDAVSRVEALSRSVGSGMRFIPAEITDTVVGPPPRGGGPRGDRQNRLNVVIGEHMTPRILARQILPLWTTATPFTPPGQTTPNPLTLIDDETLAKGLMVYNRYYLGLPNMSKWQAGLRFPLPISLTPDPANAARVIGTLHPDVIVSLASTFDPAWMPLLDQGASALAAPDAQAEDDAATAFLAQNTDAMSRGMALAFQAISNAPATLVLFLAVNRQLSDAERFEVALAFMDALVNPQVDILAAQTMGMLMLWDIEQDLQNHAPADISAEQQRRFDRANTMLGRITPQLTDTPDARRNRAEKTITVDTVRLDGSSHNPQTQIAVANAIYSQCNVRVLHGVDATASATQTTDWLGADRNLRASRSCGGVTREERAMYNGATTDFGLTQRIRAFFVQDSIASGYSMPRYCATGPARAIRDMAVVNNSGDTDTLAHEMGHILINSGSHRPAGSIMAPRQWHSNPQESSRPTVVISDRQCNRIYRNV